MVCSSLAVALALLISMSNTKHSPYSSNNNAMKVQDACMISNCSTNILFFFFQLDVENFTSIVWSNIKQDFKKELSEHTLDSLYFLMVANKKFPDVVKLRKLIGTSEILCEDNIQPVCEKLMVCTLRLN